MDYLHTDIQYIKGVGPARAKAMAKLGIHTLEELIHHFPRDYEDRRLLKPTKDIEDGESVCCELLVAAPAKLSHIRSGLDLVKLTAADEYGTVGITWFNQTWMKNAFEVGDTVVFYGKFSRKGNKLELSNPIHEKAGKDDSALQRIMPIYPLTAGVSQSHLQNAMLQGLEACRDVFPEPVPRELRERYQLASAAYAYENIHFPQDEHALQTARRKLVFEECFILACAQKRLGQLRSGPAGRHPTKASQADFESRLPFQLTGAQKRVLKEAFHDMLEGEHPMNRLVQGDVGSGKTVVAAACCWLCGLSDMQSAVMAPTEILAEQHFQTFRALLEPFGMKVELLTGSMPAKEKRAVQARLASGETQVAVGTHALLSDAVSFQNLTLCVVDEQHRFGVLQRACLAHKGQEPHIMVMSATPIPRTLALMIYGDLDISVIDELPPGRQEIETYSVKEKMRTRIEAFARKQIEAGRQVYWICPMVEDKEEDAGLQSAEAKAEKLARQVFPDLRIGLLHGKMKPKEKNSVMQAFAAGELDILVATTVVEVGVDVPNANLIIIENADRFGLSQLHQLRGRVGRGRHASYCVLFDNGGNDVSAERLKVMTQTNNGFTIAETDLKLRGPGDFLGSRQHGLPEMKIASLADDMDLLYAASEAAELLLRADPKLTMENHGDIKRSTDALYAGFAGGMN